jgi:hypothetical protein
LRTVGAGASQEIFKMKKRSEYTAAEWANLYPDQRAAALQAETDDAVGRNAIPVRGPDGRSTIFVDRTTRAPVTAAPPRRIGGLV